MEIYRKTCRRIMTSGFDREDRTGVGNRALFGIPMRFDLQNGFPILTTKFTPFRLILAELLWFMAGDPDERNLRKLGCPIWQANADYPGWQPKAKFPGDVGRNYGVQWRSWNGPDGGIDQLSRSIEMVINQPNNRRNVVTAWNPGELDQTALPPCHLLYQFSVGGDKLFLGMYQRSCDLFLGVPFNISSYALLLHLVAQFAGLVPAELGIMFWDTHIYRNHFEQVGTLLSLDRHPYPLPTLWLNPKLKSLEDVVGAYRDMLHQVDLGAKPQKLLDRIAHLENYHYHPAISAPMAV